ncbi:IST1-like protein [Actinidia chinensis var. chinensis]|uniref:IST1-like protein n=1 Tax=Actinidia chinensis var. chinensis TaxID=1590841 RepID=A0A2R6RKP1_ACTCC|nr:IST1-like protein [Actinidia chinensis var. chinensis]
MYQIVFCGGGNLLGAASSGVSVVSEHQLKRKEENMGKKLDTLLRRNSKPPKLKTLANFAIARITVLKNQHQVRCSHARSDVAQLLNLGHQDRALLHVEHVIREQNMLDVLIVIENYCHHLIDGILLVENNRECPDELNEAISSLIFASSRCGELPELQEIKGIFTSRYGKEFVARANELRNNCRVNLKLKQIASDNGITLHLEEDGYATAEEKITIEKEKELQPNEAANLNDLELGVDAKSFSEMITRDEKFSESMKGRKKYKDVAAAARDPFESAAYAAAAARAAVELSRPESWDEDPGGHSNHTQEIVFIYGDSLKSKLEIVEDAATEHVKPVEKGPGFDKIHPVDSFCTESEGEDMSQKSKRSHLKDLERSYKKKEELERTLSRSSSDTDTGTQYEGKATSNLDQTVPPGEEIVFDESDDETGKNWGGISKMKQHHSALDDERSNLPINEFQNTRYKTVADENCSDKEFKLHWESPRRKPLKSQADYVTHFAAARSRLGNTDCSSKSPGEEIVFDESDDETGKNWGSISWMKHHHSALDDERSNLPVNKLQKPSRYKTVADEKFSDKDIKLHWESPRRKPVKSQADDTTHSVEARSRLRSTDYLSAERHYLYSQYSNRKPTSMTRRHVHRD